MSYESFKSLDLGAARESLEQLHEQVIRHRGRVTITTDESEQCTVLISLVELQSLEHALMILSQTADAGEMRDHVLRLSMAVSREESADATLNMAG